MTAFAYKPIMPPGQLVCFAESRYSAIPIAKAGRRLYEPERHRSHALVYGAHDPGVCTRFVAAWTGWMLGYPDQAQTSIEDALDLAERLGHPLSLLLALVFATVTDQFRREPESAWQHLGRA